MEDFWGGITGKSYDNVEVVEWAINKYVPFLNEVGGIGWELIDIQHTNKNYGQIGLLDIVDKTIYFFKRLATK